MTYVVARSLPRNAHNPFPARHAARSRRSLPGTEVQGDRGQEVMEATVLLQNEMTCGII
jgi:hypothetical protein